MTDGFLAIRAGDGIIYLSNPQALTDVNGQVRPPGCTPGTPSLCSQRNRSAFRPASS